MDLLFLFNFDDLEELKLILGKSANFLKVFVFFKIR